MADFPESMIRWEEWQRGEDGLVGSTIEALSRELRLKCPGPVEKASLRTGYVGLGGKFPFSRIFDEIA
jgi:hypothetical protein